MIILWRANFDGTQEQMDTADRKLKELSKEHGYGLDGPYYPQDASLLYILRGSIEQMNKSGRAFIPWLEEEGIPLTPLEFEVAITPEEFWGPS